MRSESEFDPFGAGHASTSISAALGMATARDLRGGEETVVAVIGDGALTGGLAYEAINNAGQMKTNFIVILNDNEMSIAPNVGSIASYLSVLRTKPLANFAREKAKDVFGHVPFGGTARKAFCKAETGRHEFRFARRQDGGDLRGNGLPLHRPDRRPRLSTRCATSLETRARASTGPVLLHVRTVKGKGFEPAENDCAHVPRRLGLFDVENGKLEIKPGARPTFSDAFADALIDSSRRPIRK